MSIAKHIKFNGRLGQLYITNGKIMWVEGATIKKFPIAGVVAEYEGGDTPVLKTTATRVAAGLIIAGPVGAIVGGMFKKDISRCYISVAMPSGESFIADVPASKASMARKFVNRINEAGVAYAEN